jgi:hypothetical protein
MGKQKTEVSIVRYTADFKPAVKFLSYLRVRFSVFPTLYTEPYFKWKIENNPFGKSACYLRWQKGVPVAHGSITAKPINPWLEVGVGAGEGGDSLTHPNFQKQGHFSALRNYYVQDFCQSEPNGVKLIYTLPNDSSLLPSIHRCGFEIFDKLCPVEFERSIWRTPSSTIKAGLRWMLRTRPQTLFRFSLCTNGFKTASSIDRLWKEAECKETYLLKKDGAWWQWRYNRATETYRTYAIKEEESEQFLVYVVVKVKWGRRLRYVQICDIFGDTSDRAVTAFKHFVQTMVLPFDTLLLWAHPASKLADAAIDEGFVKKRDVPVIFFKNQAYEQLRNRAGLMQIALGDSDHV